jgi:hypothetical protein
MIQGSSSIEYMLNFFKRKNGLLGDWEEEAERERGREDILV